MPDSVFIWTFGDIVGLIILAVFFAFILVGSIIEGAKWVWGLIVGLFRGNRKR